MTVLKMKPIELIKKANREETIREDFDIIVQGQSIRVSMSMPDIFTIMEDQEKAYAIKLGECTKDGMADLPINEAAWEKELSEITDKEAKEKFIEDKPKNLAEQTASRLARFTTVRKLIPKILRDQEGNFLGTTSEEHAEIGQYLANG